MLEFSRQFPEVVAGKKRGSFDHVRFSEVYAAISFTSDETHGRMMCFIEYSRKVDTKYGWSVQQARVKWSYWKGQGVASDQLGEVDGWPNRLMIPVAKISIAGERMEHSKQMIAESKRQKALTEADFQDGLLSIQSGHQNFKNSDVFTGSGDMASTGLGPSRFTGLDATGLGLFHDSKTLPPKSAVAAEAVAQTNPNSQAAAEQLKTGGQRGSQPAGDETAEAGIGAKRLPRFQKMRKEVENMETKTGELILLAYATVQQQGLQPEDQDFRSIVMQGLGMLTSLMCVDVKISPGSDGQAPSQPVLVTRKPQDETTQAQFNEALWQQSLKDVPVECRPQCNYAKLMAWSSMVATCNKIKDAPTTLAIAENEKIIADYKAEMLSFGKCLRKSVASLDTQLKTRKTVAQIESSRKIADTRKAEASRKQEEAIAARLRRANVLTLEGQKVKWHTARAQHCERILEVDMTTVVEARGPWVMTTCDELTAALEAVSLCACMNSFGLKHTEHPLMKPAAAGVVFAPVPQQISTEPLMQIVDRAVDRRLKMASLISSDLQHFDQFYLVGRRIDKTFSSHCPGFIGQIMIPCGSMTVDIWMTDFRPFL